MALVLSILVILATQLTIANGHDHSRDISGSFQSPGSRVRPRFRYWLPDASVDPSRLAADITGIGSIGAGGIELCNYYLYGGEIPTPVTDWDIYGFGTPAYKSILKAALQATKDNDLVMDFAMGPQSGQGVPAEPENRGLAYDLVSYSTTVAPGQSYIGAVPGHGGRGTLVSLTTAAVLNETFFSNPVYTLGMQTGWDNYTVSFIAADSLTDITNKISRNGSISISFPSNPAVKKYLIYSSYYELSGARACIPGQHPQNFIQNGSFAVDHFSAEGAKVITDFLEKYVMINGVKELFQQVGNYIWEDSVEVPSPLYWTPLLATVFKKMHGYDVGKYTMLLAYGNGLGFGTLYPQRFFSDAPDRDQGYITDYRATLSYLLGTYYEHLTDWSNNYLGLGFSGQIGYNLPVDMLQVVPSVNAPEDESLGFNNNIGISIYPLAKVFKLYKLKTNMGAVQFEAYQLTLPNLLTMVKKAYSAGNNEMVFHGATYSYQYPNTTWPGYTSFAYIFSGQHSRHQPAWENGYSDMLGFVARSNFILQSGIPKRHIVFWNKQTAQNDSIPTLYAYSDLVNHGYGYEYLSPNNFQLPQAIVVDGLLAPSGPAYKALIIRSTGLLTTDGVAKLSQFAHDGLPIIFAGGIPSQIGSADGLYQVQSALKSLQSLPNVHQVPAGPIAGALKSLGIEPLTKISTNGTWYTYWRQDGPKDYIYLYNDGNYSTGTVSFSSTNHPYFFDSWTGSQTPILEYTIDSGYTAFSFSLAPSQSVIVAFLPDSPHATPEIHVTSSSPSILGFSYSPSSGLVAKAATSDSIGEVSLSDGRDRKFPVSSVPPAFRLGDWTLIVEKWSPPDNLTDIDTLAAKSNATYMLPDLLSWPSIPGLANTSGVGFYCTTFAWSDASIGAVIDFGRVVHTLRVKINGNQLPPLDFTSAKADISEYLVKGQNKVEAITATVMINGLAPILTELKTSGFGPAVGLETFASLQVEAGLVETVTVTPYVNVKITSS